MGKDNDEITLNGVKEHIEKRLVKLAFRDGRLVLKSFNEGGYSSTEIDLLQLIKWLKENMPELIV